MSDGWLGSHLVPALSSIPAPQILATTDPIMDRNIKQQRPKCQHVSKQSILWLAIQLVEVVWLTVMILDWAWLVVNCCNNNDRDGRGRHVDDGPSSDWHVRGWSEKTGRVLGWVLWLLVDGDDDNRRSSRATLRNRSTLRLGFKHSPPGPRTPSVPGLAYNLLFSFDLVDVTVRQEHLATLSPASPGFLLVLIFISISLTRVPSVSDRSEWSAYLLPRPKRRCDLFFVGRHSSFIFHSRTRLKWMENEADRIVELWMTSDIHFETHLLLSPRCKITRRICFDVSTSAQRQALKSSSYSSRKK